MRVDGNRLEKSIMIGLTEGKQKRGKPHLRWMDEIMGTTRLTMDKLREMTRDMNDCRQLTVNI